MHSNLLKNACSTLPVMKVDYDTVNKVVCILKFAGYHPVVV